METSSEGGVAGRSLLVDNANYFFGLMNWAPNVGMERPRSQTRYEFNRDDYVELYFTQRAAVRSLLHTSSRQVSGYTTEAARASLQRSVGVFSAPEGTALSLVGPADIDSDGCLSPEVVASVEDGWTQGVVLAVGTVDLSSSTILVPRSNFGNPFLSRCNAEESWAFHGHVPLASRATYPSFVRLLAGIAPQDDM